MIPQNFCYWLQGYFELTNSNNITKDQLKVIKEHLDLVLNNSITSTESPTYCYNNPITDAKSGNPLIC